MENNKSKAVDSFVKGSFGERYTNPILGNETKSNAIEVLREYKKNYELLRKTGKKCINTNNVEVILMPYPEFCKALLALEKLDRLEKWLNEQIELIDNLIKELGNLKTLLAQKQILEDALLFLKEKKSLRCLKNDY